MDTAFIIGNGESRNIFPIENLKDKGVIYGCNAIYRDHPMLCDHIVAVNPPMYKELLDWHNNGKESPIIYGINDISKWNYLCEGDSENDVPEGLKIYRIWRGGNMKKGGKIKTNDFSKARGSGCSAVVLAAESGIKNITIVSPGFVTDCLETLDEIKNEAYEIFVENGGKKLNYVNCLNDSLEGIDLFKYLISKNLLGWED